MFFYPVVKHEYRTFKSKQTLKLYKNVKYSTGDMPLSNKL